MKAVQVRVSTKIDILNRLLIRDGGRWVPLFRDSDCPTLC
jgi:hypothetical protein